MTRQRPPLTALHLHPDDDVICLLRDHSAGEVPDLDGVKGPKLIEDVPLGHKVARTNLSAGTEVRKYGHPIGVASRAIGAGEHVHLHNLRGLKTGQAK